MGKKKLDQQVIGATEKVDVVTRDWVNIAAWFVGPILTLCAFVVFLGGLDVLFGGAGVSIDHIASCAYLSSILGLVLALNAWDRSWTIRTVRAERVEGCDHENM